MLRQRFGGATTIQRNPKGATQSTARAKQLPAGDVVTAQSTIETIKTLGRNVVMTTRTEVRTVDGEQVCTAYSTLVERGTAGEAE